MIPLLACQEEEPAKQIGSGPAHLQLQLADLRYEFVDGRHKYFHKRKVLIVELPKHPGPVLRKK